MPSLRCSERTFYTAIGRRARDRGVNGLALLNPASEPATGLASFTNARVKVYRAWRSNGANIRTPGSAILLGLVDTVELQVAVALEVYAAYFVAPADLRPFRAETWGSEDEVGAVARDAAFPKLGDGLAEKAGLSAGFDLAQEDLRPILLPVRMWDLTVGSE